MLADYHVHCEFSEDSTERMEDMILRGIELKLDEICFTDHVDYGIRPDWDEGEISWRGGDGIGTPKDVLYPNVNVNYPEYFGKLLRMQKTFKDKIVIKKGLEFGIQTITIDKFEKLYDRYEDELDFILFSVHQVDNKEFWLQDYQRGKSQQEYNEGYYKQIYEVQKRYKNYSVLSHLDHIIRYDLQGIYPYEKVKDLIAEILKLAIKDDKGIEINTSSWHYNLKDTTPSREILKLYKDLGGKIITMGSDAHSIKYLADHFADARKILKEEIGFKEFCTFEKMVPIFHEL